MRLIDCLVSIPIIVILWIGASYGMEMVMDFCALNAHQRKHGGEK